VTGYKIHRYILKPIALLWASPYTLFGLTVGIAGLCSGGQAQLRMGVLEFHGGATTWFVDRLPGGFLVSAITFGHTILGRNAECLDHSRLHEQVHVRQYERWGPLFGPAYLLCSLVLRLQGRDAYRENPFEVEAYRVAP